MSALCSLDYCDRKLLARGLCRMHYKRLLKGAPLNGPHRLEIQPAARFWSLVLKTDGCWNWQGGTGRGYGRFCIEGRLVQAHVFAYQQAFGAVPEGLVLDHLCRNRACVNPAHLEPVTMPENSRRVTGATAISCTKGHVYTPWNIAFRSDGRIRCRTCLRQYARESQSRRRARSEAGSLKEEEG